ncbi:MAG: hypothetical protein KY476_13815 [Planctomycetes bacterium]|nr:hypothetical protein [Planctomycetota bacterium]
MRSQANGVVATLAMFVPLLAVPFLAAVVVPQLTGTAESATVNDVDSLVIEDIPTDSRAGSTSPSAARRPADRRSSAEDLFASFERPDSATAGAENLEREPPPWNDPFHSERPPLGGAAPADAAATLADASAADRVRPIDASRRDEFDRVLSLSNAGGAEAAERPRPQIPPIRDDAFDTPSDAASGALSNFPSRGTSRNGVPAVAPAAIDTWDDAIERLNAYGIDDFQLSPGGGGRRFHFTCLLAGREDGLVARRFEAEADEPLDAVRGVLAQLDEWTQQN